MPYITFDTTTDEVTITGSTVVVVSGTLTPTDQTKINNLPTDTSTELAAKVDKVTGKGLSTNDYDNTEKAKVTANTLKVGITTEQSNAIASNTNALDSKADLVGGKVPASQLPEGIDEVQEYANLAAFPATGATNIIYVAIDTNKTYRWGSTVYAETSTSLALGESSSTAYRGDRGATAYTHSQSTSNPHGVTKAQLGLTSVEDKSSATIRSEIVDSDIPSTIARTSAIPTTTTNLTDTAAKRFVSDAEKATWNANQDVLLPTVTDLEILQKKTGGGIEGTGKTLNDIVVKKGGSVTDGVITFKNTAGTINASTAEDTLSGNTTYTSIVGTDHGAYTLIVNNNNYTVNFNLGTTLGEFVNYSGKYYIKIFNVGDSTTPNFFFMDLFAVGSTTSAGDTTPPTPSNESISGQTETSVVFNCQASEPATIYAAAYSNSFTGTLLLSELIAGTGAISGTATSVQSGGGAVEALQISPLANGTTYKIYYGLIDLAGNETGVFGPIAATTVLSDTTAPIFNTASVINMTTTGGLFRFNVNEGGTVYMWVGADGATPADNAALKAGTAAVDFANIAVTGGSTFSLTIDSLTENTPYDLWYIARDAAGNESTMAKIDITTIASSAVPDSLTTVLKGTTGILCDYYKYLPADYNENTYYPVIVSFHGLGQTSNWGATPLSAVLDVGIGWALNLDLINPDCIVVVPQHPRSGYWNAPVTEMDQIIDHVRNEAAFGHKVDSNKVHITGYSQGGTGIIEYLKDTTRRAKICSAMPMSPGDQAETFSPSWDEVYLWFIHGYADTNSPTNYIKSVQTYYGTLQRLNPIAAALITLQTDGTHTDAFWNGYFSGANYDKAVTNTTYNGTAITSTVYTSANNVVDWMLGKSKPSSDVTPPVLETPTAGSIGETQFTGTFQSNEAGTLYAAIYPTADTAHTKAEIQAGTGAVAFINGGKALTAAQNVTHVFSGLTQSTAYKIHAWCDDIAGNESGVVLSAEFSTIAEDVTPPTISNVTVDTLAQTTAAGHAQIDEAGTIYIAVTLSTAGTLTPAQIKAGTDGSIVFADSSATAGGTIEDFAITGLSASTTYKMQVAAEDSNLNMVVSATVSSNFDTALPPSGNPRVLVNMGSSSSATNWNNWANPTTGGLTNMIDENGDATTVDITKISGSGGVLATNGAQTGDNSGVFPDSVLHSLVYSFNDSTGLYYRIDGLAADSVYRITFVGSNTASFGENMTEYIRLNASLVDQQTVELYILNNTANSVFMDFTSNASGQAWFRFRRKAASTYGILNGLSIQLQ